MINKRAQAIVEGSLLSGIAVILWWLSYYIFPFIFLCSLPFIFLSYKWDWKISSLSLIVTLMVVSLFINPLNTFFLYLPSGVLGIVLGWGIKKDLSLGKLFFLSSSANLFLELLTIAGSIILFKLPLERVLGIDILKEGLKNSFNIEYLEGIQKQILSSINLIIPSLLILSSFSQVILNYWIAYKIFKRFKWNLKALPSIDTLRIPRKLWNILFITLILSLVLSYFTSLGINIFNNVIFLLQFLLVLEGFFVIWSYLQKNISSNFLKILIILFFLFNPFLTFFVFILGVIDIFYPIREKFLMR
ncbi:MAG: DUF2232 domain-containing protein [Dictyoglomaceae bacterium]